MKKLIFVSSIIGALALVGGCMAYASPQGDQIGVVGVEIGGPEIAIGFYDPEFGFWTGSDWDRSYYERGHGGYGHERYHGGRYINGGRGHGGNRGGRNHGGNRGERH